jgi:hypothetical protein
MLVGNKVDLVEKNSQARKVIKEDAANFATENKLLFEEASAITSQNVTQVFELLLESILISFIIIYIIFTCPSRYN